LVDAFKNEKVFKFLHLPVQSGDDNVLKSMNRCYTVQEFRLIVEAFRASFPWMTLATDVICGFPGETYKAFENTLRLVSEVQPDIVNVSKFFARPGTAAASMTEGLVGQAEIKRRSALLYQLGKQTSLERNQRWIGWEGTILIDEKGKISGSWVGRNFAYKPVTIMSNADLLGKILNVKIVKSFGTYLAGTITE
jgi:tRNA A37 methylthiotransferase MiaB